MEALPTSVRRAFLSLNVVPDVALVKDVKMYVPEVAGVLPVASDFALET